MRLIDADKLDEIAFGKVTRNEYKLVDRILFEFPTIDPVKHGRWMKLGEDMECSCCWGIVEILNYNFCPNCGAKMDEVDTCTSR